MAGLVDGLSYGVTQSARFAWYLGHYLAAAHFDKAQPRSGQKHSPEIDSGVFWRALGGLFARDWRNIDAGIYRVPRNSSPRPLALAQESFRFLADVPRVVKRRSENGGKLRTEDEDNGASYPKYYLQNFHFQTGGYLTPESAALYDFQVETLFLGAADAMRRQALPPIYEALTGRDQRKQALLDLGCGTGRFLACVKENYPRLPVTGIDLSDAYLARARRTLRDWRGVTLLHANAESVPLPDRSVDFVTAIFLFHELPPKARRAVAHEVSRVLRPGGRFILLDSLQLGDTPEFDPLILRFPQRFHEPFYLSYAKENLPALFFEAGLRHQQSDTAFLSKCAVFQKP